MIHDCIHRVLKIFFISRYKPAGLNFTRTQLLSPMIDCLMVVFGLAGNIKTLLYILKKREDLTCKYKHMLFTSVYTSMYPFALKNREKQVLRYRRRKFGNEGRFEMCTSSLYELCFINNVFSRPYESYQNEIKI